MDAPHQSETSRMTQSQYRLPSRQEQEQTRTRQSA